MQNNRTLSSQAWLYLIAAGLSVLGNSVATVVWPWMVLRATGSASAAGIVAASIAIPSLMFAIVGGNLIDKYGRKPLSIISDIISGLSIVLLIVTANVGYLSMATLIIIGIIGAVGDIPGMAARNALVADVSRISGYSVEKIAGINQSIMGICFLVGPAATGLMMAALELTQVLWITAACSLLAALATVFIRVNAPSAPSASEVSSTQLHAIEEKALQRAGIITNDDDNPYRGLRGWKIVLSHPIIRLLALMTALSGLLVAPYLTILMPAHFESTDNPAMLGASMSAYAIGMTVAGLFAAKFTGLHRTTWILATGLYALSYTMMAFLGHEWIVFAAMLVAGVGGGLFSPLSMVLITKGTEDEVRGRAFSVFMAINQTLNPVGMLLVAALVSHMSIYAVAPILAVVYVSLTLVAIIWGMRLLHDEKPPAESDNGSVSRPTSDG